jgi:toxin ParE1/3/4
MTTSEVRFAPEALEHLAELERYLADVSSPRVAANYVDGIVAYCESLRTFPHRGHRRDDIRPGLRLTNYRGRTTIAFVVEADQPVVIGVFYGGRDVELALTAADNESSQPFHVLHDSAC